MCLMGIDVGTSGCKATVIDVEGCILGQAYKEYSLVTPQPGWQEIDPDLVWDCVREVIKRSLSGYKGAKIEALSVSSFGEAVVPVDRKGKVLHNSIIYIDSRGIEEAAYLENRLGNQKILGITGVSAHSMYSVSKIMWLKAHMPSVYGSTWKFLLFADFILFKLGAEPHTDYSLAARTMAFDIINKRWSADILECAGVDEGRFGKPVQAGTVVGQLSKSMAEELGLHTGLILVAGGHDQPCAALGAGVVKSGMAVDGLGTTECVTPAFDKPVISEAMAGGSFACVPHVLRDMYVTYAFTFTSGSLLKWFRDSFGHAYREEAAKSGMNIYDFLIENAAKEISEVFVLPHFAGAATPYMDNAAKGAIVGLDINTGKEHIIKAILEGITFEMMVNVERLHHAGVGVEELRAVGGLAKSESFLQLKADMMGKKVTTLNVSEAGTLGAAILAGTACGVFSGTEDAVGKLVKKKKEFVPDKRLHELYQQKYEIYKRIYPAMKSIFKE